MKKLIKYASYMKPYWKQAVLAITLLICVVFMDLSIPRLVQRIIDDGIHQKNMSVVYSTSLIMLGISLLSTLFSIGQNTLSVRAAEAFARDLREAIFVKIQSFSYGNLDQLKTGDLIVRLTSDINILQQTYRMSMRIGLRGPLLIIGSIILMVTTDASLTLKIVPLLVLTILLIIFFISKLGPIFRKVQKNLSKLNNVLQENIAGVRVVKAFVRRSYEKDRFEVVNAKYTEIHIKIMRFVSIIFPMLMFLINMGVFLIVWAGGKQAITGDLTIGEIVAFSNYLMTTMTPLMIMAMLANVVASGMVSAERIDKVLTTEPEVQDLLHAENFPKKIKGRVQFKDVSFYYNGNSREKVLDTINLTVEPGENIAILGATGSGKSTLINLIPRFYDVSEGSILIDGKDIKNISQESLLTHIGITPQETILFSGTIRDNISYGKPEASDEEIIKVAKLVQAHDFIMDLPNGYDTFVAARGVSLSGGQKQRIAIARAVLLKPEILILDDSTSSVDVATETKIQDALEELMKESTTFIVAQRISTVLRADKIIVLDCGKIRAEGTHHELMKTSPIYREIYDSQLGEGNQLVQKSKKK
ncbi:MAG: ABC transporter ATP-binding protein [Anaerolineaceae bacterium]|nr:ABC transporter ATP-binding protein [Anaerolineaceae bacterium]